MKTKWFGALAAWLLSAGMAHGQQPDALVLPVRVVDGHLMVVGYVTSASGDINDVSLEVSFEDPGVFTLDADQYQWLGAPPAVKLLLKPGVALEFDPAEVRPERRDARKAMHDRLTRVFSNQLDEHKVKGILGLGFLRKYDLVLDIAAGRMTLSPPGTLDPQGEVTMAFTLEEDRVSFPLDYAQGKSGRMVLGGDAYDTYINAGEARRLGKPAGDVSPVWLGAAGGIDLSRQMAPRPGDTRGATAVGGVNLLEAFRIELGWGRSKIAFTPTRTPPYPQADLAYFQAELENSVASFLEYLRHHPAARLSPQAAQRLLALRLAGEGATDAQFMEALHWVAQTSAPERKMEDCAVAVREFRALPGREELVAQAGTFALQFSREAVSVQDTYRLHNIIGEAYLSTGQLEPAWEHLLSAAFMPLGGADLVHDIEVNRNLARVYERMGRVGRAYARYLRTQEMAGSLELWARGVVDDESLPAERRRQARVVLAAIPEVRAALERLKPQIPASRLEMLEG